MIVSIIIPVLNNYQMLHSCIESILENRVEGVNLEIIIIDGGSSDGTLEIIRDCMNDISYWETGLDSGISDAFNRGISKSSGELIAILNSDDYWHKDTLSHVVASYRRFSGIGAFYGKIRFLDIKTGHFFVKKPNLKHMKYRMNIFHPSLFVTRETIQKVGLYNIRYSYAMDSEWCHRAINLGINFKYIPHVLATMRLGGISDQQFKDSLKEYRRSVIQNKLAKPFEAWGYFGFFFLMKSLVQVSWVKRLKYLLQNKAVTKE